MVRNTSHNTLNNKAASHNTLNNKPASHNTVNNNTASHNTKTSNLQMQLVILMMTSNSPRNPSNPLPPVIISLDPSSTQPNWALMTTNYPLQMSERKDRCERKFIFVFCFALNIFSLVFLYLTIRISFVVVVLSPYLSLFAFSYTRLYICPAQTAVTEQSSIKWSTDLVWKPADLSPFKWKFSGCKSRIKILKQQ